MPPLPAAFDDGSANNQTPPTWVLVPEIVRRTRIAPPEIDAAQRATYEASALALVRSHMAGGGFGLADDVAPAGLALDAYGGVHVEVVQTHGGLPVLGRGAMVHFRPGEPDGLTDHLVAEISLPTTMPAVDEATAASTAASDYAALVGRAPASVEARLAVEPSFELVRVATTRSVDHLQDFRWQLVGATLVYDLLLGPTAADLEAIAPRLAEAFGSEADSPSLRALRDANATHGGHPAMPLQHQTPLEIAGEPTIQYRVDAQSGAILARHGHVHAIDAEDLEPSETDGYGYHVGRVTLETSFHMASNRHVLVDRSRPHFGLGNVVFDALNTETDQALDMAIMSDLNGSWGDGSIVDSENASLTGSRRQTPAVDVYYAMMRTWDLFANVLARDGPDGTGQALRACVHWGDGFTDAKYNAGSNFAFFGDGATATDVGNYGMHTVGHEFGHYVWHREGLGTDSGESRALNEGNGDIQGSLVALYENTANGQGALIQHHPLLAGWTSRILNPSGYSEPIPDTNYPAIGQKYWSSFLEDLPEHVGGLPLGRAFVYLAQGAPSDPDDPLHTEEFPGGLGGIGITRAASIWNQAMTAQLQGTPDYGDMYTAYAFAAASLYGIGSMEHKAVQRAFAGIRVGAGAADTEDPEITWASIYEVDVTDMTARFWATARDDTGFRAMRATYDDGSDTYLQGFYRGDLFWGYLDISRLPIGDSFVKIELTDSDGRTTSVFRPVLKPTDRNLVQNGDFEDGFSGWSTSSGESPVRSGEAWAFLGERRARMDEEDMLYQQVTIPGDAKSATLVFRLLIRNATAEGDELEVLVLDAGMGELEVLDTFHHLTPRDGRNAVNRGYVRHEYDLGAYVGQTIHIAFRNHTEENSYRFDIDQVIVTYEADPYVDVPAVRLTSWEDTVAFSIPKRGGFQDAEVSRVEYWVGGVGIQPQLVAFSMTPAFDYYAGIPLDDLPVAAHHWVGALVRGLDNAILAQSWGVWFEPVAGYTEMLVNGGFEAGGWDLAHTTGPPRIEVVENNPNFTNAYAGSHALRMGSQGTMVLGGATIGQVVSFPFQVKSLDFSARVKIQSQEAGIDDRLYLELWDANSFVRLDRILLTTSGASYETPGASDSLRRYGYVGLALDPGPYAGRDILVLLRVEEDDGLPTTFYVDQVSLRRTDFGF